MAKGTKVKTKVGELKYVFIDGEGKNNAMPGEEPRMQYTASIVFKENSPEHKAFKQLVDAEWKRYKTEFGVKGLPRTNGIKQEMMNDPDGTIDPATEAVRKVPTGNVLITFKTNTVWPDGKPQIIKVFDHKGRDITEAVRAADWSIGKGSTGIIHGVAQGNNIGGTHKVTLYLSAVQIAKLVKYEGNSIDADEIEGEDIDLDDNVAAVSEEDEIPF